MMFAPIIAGGAASTLSGGTTFVDAAASLTGQSTLTGAATKAISATASAASTSTATATPAVTKSVVGSATGSLTASAVPAVSKSISASASAVLSTTGEVLDAANVNVAADASAALVATGAAAVTKSIASGASAALSAVGAVAVAVSIQAAAASTLVSSAVPAVSKSVAADASALLSTTGEAAGTLVQQDIVFQSTDSVRDFATDGLSINVGIQGNNRLILLSFARKTFSPPSVVEGDAFVGGVQATPITFVNTGDGVAGYNHHALYAVDEAALGTLSGAQAVTHSLSGTHPYMALAELFYGVDSATPVSVETNMSASLETVVVRPTGLKDYLLYYAANCRIDTGFPLPTLGGAPIDPAYMVVRNAGARGDGDIALGSLSGITTEDNLSLGYFTRATWSSGENGSGAIGVTFAFATEASGPTGFVDIQGSATSTLSTSGDATKWPQVPSWRDTFNRTTEFEFPYRQDNEAGEPYPVIDNNTLAHTGQTNDAVLRVPLSDVGVNPGSTVWGVAADMYLPKVQTAPVAYVSLTLWGAEKGLRDANTPFAKFTLSKEDSNDNPNSELRSRDTNGTLDVVALPDFAFVGTTPQRFEVLVRGGQVLLQVDGAVVATTTGVAFNPVEADIELSRQTTGDAIVRTVDNLYLWSDDMAQADIVDYGGVSIGSGQSTSALTTAGTAAVTRSATASVSGQLSAQGEAAVTRSVVASASGQLSAQGEAAATKSVAGGTDAALSTQGEATVALTSAGNTTATLSTSGTASKLVGTSAQAFMALTTNGAPTVDRVAAGSSVSVLTTSATTAGGTSVVVGYLTAREVAIIPAMSCYNVVVKPT